MEHDPDWPLECAVGAPDAQGTIAWVPTPRATPPDFSLAERQLGALHADVQAFFGSFWLPTLAGLHAGEPVYLAGLENEQRERETVHAWLRSGSTAVILVGRFGDDRWIGAHAVTGCVSVEDAGRPSRPIAPSLAEWLDSLDALPTW